MNKVIAVIVTYNRQELLSNCITALKNQTKKVDKILVINNGSTDETSNWLKKQKSIDHISQENVGSAGGFYTGIKTAYEKEYNWIWLMDDDGYPKEDALEKLLEDDNEELLLRNCAVINKEDKKSFVWKTLHYKNIDEVEKSVIQNIAHPFNGTLLHRRIVERVGFPNPNLFLWGDETEYYYRIIKKNAIPFCTITNSIHYHPATSFSYKQEWDYKSGWKMYYYIRNRFHVHRSKFSAIAPLSYFMYAGFLIAFAFITLSFQKTDKLKKLAFIFWPAKDALSNNFSASPAYVLSRLNISSENALPHIGVSTYFKALKSLIARRSNTPLHQFEKA
ncbi:MAG: glycosyltransferase family 2 protein [Bacteroidota bacterium]|nr:glycosyltransferase family 2 protein [Bacteroidota bacterium]